MLQQEENMHIIICGNPVDGFRYIGPFDDLEAARNYLATDPELAQGNAWIAGLDIPAGETEGQ